MQFHVQWENINKKKQWKTVKIKPHNWNYTNWQKRNEKKIGDKSTKQIK